MAKYIRAVISVFNPIQPHSQPVPLRPEHPRLALHPPWRKKSVFFQIPTKPKPAVRGMGVYYKGRGGYYQGRRGYYKGRGGYYKCRGGYYNCRGGYYKGMGGY